MQPGIFSTYKLPGNSHGLPHHLHAKQCHQRHPRCSV